MTYTCITVASPVGQLKLVANGSRLAAILWENDKPGRVRLGPMSEAPDNPILVRTAAQLREYFSGTRDRFELELDFAGTEFQKKVWAALLTIPFGETRSYSQIAEQIGNPAAVRAVAALRVRTMRACQSHLSIRWRSGSLRTALKSVLCCPVQAAA